MTPQQLLALLLLPYGLWLSFDYQYHFVDGANLLFHEAGHVVLRPFGDWLQFLGGTLGQLAFPVAVFIHFQRQQQRFETGVCALWADTRGHKKKSKPTLGGSACLPGTGGHKGKIAMAPKAPKIFEGIFEGIVGSDHQVPTPQGVVPAWVCVCVCVCVLPPAPPKVLKYSVLLTSYYKLWLCQGYPHILQKGG